MEITLNEILVQNEKNPLFLSLLSKGVIPLSVLDKKVYYEFYKLQCQELESESRKGWKMDAITITAEEFNVSENTIYRAIKTMTS